MTHQQHTFDKIIEREKGLHRDLTSAQITMIAIGGAIGTGLFLGSGFAIRLAGPAVLVSYSIGAVIALLLMGALAEMTVAHPTSGSFGAYAEHYVGPLAGFLVRYAYWSAVVFAVGTEISAIAVFMKYWFPQVPGWYWVIGLSFVLIAFNMASVALFGVVEYVFSLLKILAIVIFIALGAYLVATAPEKTGIGFQNYLVHGGFFPKGVWGMWVAVIVAIFSYMSIETVAIAAGEARNPQRAVTRAFRSTVFRLILFYLLTLVLMLAVVPWTQADTSESPFVKVMAATHIPYAAGVINFVVLVAALSAVNSQLYVTTRMMFSLSRAKLAPALFGRVGKNGVPLAALFLSTSGIAVAVVLVARYPNTAFTWLLALSMFGALFTWLMIFVTHLCFRRRYQGPALVFQMWFYPFGSLLGAVLVGGVLLTTALTVDFRMTMVYGLVFIALLTAAFQFHYRAAYQK